METPDHTAAYREANRRSAGLALWTLAWVASLALAKFGPGMWDSQPAASWAAVTLNVAVGIGWIVAHARLMRGVDELQRKIMQDALAITLGVGWVGGFAYIVADSADLLAGDLDMGVFPALLAVIYIAAIVVGRARYR